MAQGCNDLYRADGVRITHDPYAPHMAEKYGLPGKTDSEGFDPYADTVGAGIYGGIVQRDPATGAVLTGRQYQGHNPRPGPLYAGGGYTPMCKALRGGARSGFSALRELLDKYPELVNDVSAGGASPLHMCGMGQDSQGSTEFLIYRGASMETLDTYGMTPLHRMASNNLDVGAKALLTWGADMDNVGTVGITPLQMAKDSRATKVITLLKAHAKASFSSVLAKPAVRVEGVGSSLKVNGVYTRRTAKAIPLGFSVTCAKMKWNTEEMWERLSDQRTPWYEITQGDHENAYIYWNRGDGQWWIDSPDGTGVFVAKASQPAAAAVDWAALRWTALTAGGDQSPQVTAVL